MSHFHLRIIEGALQGWKPNCLVHESLITEISAPPSTKVEKHVGEVYDIVELRIIEISPIDSSSGSNIIV